jgi:hypothetical protein
MRRILSILFTLVLTLGPVMAAVPAQALASGWTGKIIESRIPACCRKNGKHHCAMPDGAGSTETSVSAPSCCPNFPATLASATVTFAAIPSTGAASLALSAQRRPTQARIEIARASDRRVQPKRGPPSQTI